MKNNFNIKSTIDRLGWAGLSLQTKGAVLVFSGAIFFSSKAIFIKLAYHYEVKAVDLLALRMLFSLPFFLWIAYGQRSSKTTKLSTRDWASIFGLGVVGYYLASLFDFIGLQYITASLERLVLFAYPTIVLFVSAIFFKKPVNTTQTGAIVLTYLGIVLAFWGDFQLAPSAELIWGSLWVFASAVAYALYLVGSGQMIPCLGALRFNALAMTGASIGVLTHTWIANGLDLFHFSTEVYVYSLGMALIATVLASFFVAAGIGKLGAGNASIISSVGPISTIVLANVFLGEVITVYQILGTGFVMAGVLMITLYKNKPEKVASSVS